MIKSKKGFTLAEVMVTLMVIGVISGITIPILSNAKAEKDPQVYKKALYSLQRATYNLMNGTGYLKLQKELQNKGGNYNESVYLHNFTNEDICKAIANELNTTGYKDEHCKRTGEEDPNFITSDGIGFYNLGGSGKFTHKIVLIKRVGESKSETKARKNKGSSPYVHENGFMRIHMNYKGKISVPSGDILYPETNESTNEISYNYKNYNWGYEQSLIGEFTKLNGGKK